MTRAFLIVMDSVGCGGAPDAGAFGDAGANTLAHIAQACAAGCAEDRRSGPLQMPVLDGLGLGAAVRLASGEPMPGLDAVPAGRWGAASEVSRGKDTPSGHWELAGVPVPWDWTYFPDTVPAFPPDLLADHAQEHREHAAHAGDPAPDRRLARKIQGQADCCCLPQRQPFR